MGIIPRPIDPGNDCPCFPAGATPTLLKVFFGGIETGDKWVDTLPPPPNGYHDVTQNIITPCTHGIGGPATYRVKYTSIIVPGGGADLWCQVGVGTWAFTTGPSANCNRFFTNVQVNPFNEWYINGWGFVCTPAEMQGWIEMVTPITGPDPRMELFPMEDDQVVLKFCDKQSASNIKIKLDTTLL